MGFFDLFKKKQDNAPAAQQPAEQAAEQKREREELAEGLQKTKSGLFSKLARAVAGPLDQSTSRFWTIWRRCS